MNKIILYILIIYLFSSCTTSYTKPEEINTFVEVNNMENIAPFLGIASGQMYYGQNSEATIPDGGASGSPASTIDGDDYTEYRSFTNTNNNPVIKTFKALINIHFSGPVEVISVTLSMEGYADKNTGCSSTVTINGIQVLSLYEYIGEVTCSLKELSKVTDIITDTRFQSSYGNAWMSVKEIKVYVAYIDSGLRIKKGDIIISLAGNKHSSLRFKDDTGIKCLALVNTGDAIASPVRIQTLSGIKSVARWY